MTTITEGIDVIDRLRARGVEFDLIAHGTASSGLEEARTIGIAADEVVKAIIVDTADGYVAFAVPASRRLDLHLVRAVLGDPHARLASEEEIEVRWPQFELGALPPLGSMLGVPLYIDPELLAHETIIFAAGIQTESVRIRTRDAFRDEVLTSAPVTLERDLALAG